MAVQCRAVAFRGVAHIGDRKAVRRRRDLGPQKGIVEVLDDAHPDDVDDLALIARDPLVEEGEVGTLHRVEPRDILPFHLVDRHDRRRLAAQAGIDIRHGLPPFCW